MGVQTLPSLSDLAADDALVVYRRCKDFETAWKEWQGGNLPVLEEWLIEGPAAVRAVLLGEILRLDLGYRRCKAKERPVLDDYLGRFRSEEAVIVRVFEEPVCNSGNPSEFSTMSRLAALAALRGFDEADERPAPPEAALPQHIGRYRVERALGQGGFGIVYLAHDDTLIRQLAIKVPHRKHVASPEDAEVYLAEARAVASLDHPNIVPVHDVGSTAEFPCYIVSKYVDGTDLAKRLKMTRISIYETVELVATVAEALHHAHKQGLVHRDIKPGNILLNKNGTPFVADFGLALREQDMGKGPRYAGTPAYMSPEQARGEGPWVDGRSDIFSLGVVLYEMLVGRRPFHAESREELLEQISTQEVRPPRQWDELIPKKLERICLKALSKRVSDRYTTTKDLADALRDFLKTASAQEKAAAHFMPVDESVVSTSASSLTPVTDDQRRSKIAPNRSTQTETPPNGKGRKLSTRLAVFATLAILGLAIWLVAFTPWRGQPDRQEAAPRSLDFLKRDAPFQLLERKPLAVGWDFDNPRWQTWNPEEKLLQIMGGPGRLLVIGTTTLPSYDFEVDIKQAPWTGEVGIFWGLHEDEALKQQKLPKQEFAWFHFLRIEHRIGHDGQPVQFVHRGKGSLRYNQQQDVAVDTTSLFAHAIKRLTGQVQLKIAIKGNRLVSAELAREFLTELCSDDANGVYQAVPYRGGIGLLALTHAATFSEVRFVSRSNP